jgi:hypothetical protein
MITAEDAIDIARAECERHGHTVESGIRVSRGLFRSRLRVSAYTNDGMWRTMSEVTMSPATGKVENYFVRRLTVCRPERDTTGDSRLVMRLIPVREPPGGATKRRRRWLRSRGG